MIQRKSKFIISLVSVLALIGKVQSEYVKYTRPIDVFTVAFIMDRPQKDLIDLDILIENFKITSLSFTSNFPSFDSKYLSVGGDLQCARPLRAAIQPTSGPFLFSTGLVESSTEGSACSTVCAYRSSLTVQNNYDFYCVHGYLLYRPSEASGAPIEESIVGDILYNLIKTDYKTFLPKEIADMRISPSSRVSQ